MQELINQEIDTIQALDELLDRFQLRYRDFFAASEAALAAGDDVGAFDSMFAHNALLEEEYARAVRMGDVGSMWEVLREWVHLFRGAGQHNYANGIMEMFLKFSELPDDYKTFYEASWLVNDFGTPNGYYGADLAVEHDVGTIKVSLLVINMVCQYQESNISSR